MVTMRGAGGLIAVMFVLACSGEKRGDDRAPAEKPAARVESPRGKGTPVAFGELAFTLPGRWRLEEKQS